MLPLSAIMTSPETSYSFRKSCAFLMQAANVRASLRQGITMDNSSCTMLTCERECVCVCVSSQSTRLANRSANELPHLFSLFRG